MKKVDKLIKKFLTTKVYTLMDGFFLMLLFSLDDKFVKLLVIIGWLVYNNYVLKKMLRKLDGQY